MSATNLFPVIGSTEARRYIAQARAEPNAVSARLRGITEARIAEVMRAERCDYRAACIILGRRGGELTAARKARARVEAERRSREWVLARRPDLRAEFSTTDGTD